MRGLVPLLFLLLLIVWGYSWVLMKIGLMDAGAVTFAALRTFIGAVVLLAALPVLRRPFWPSRWRETLLLGVVQTTIFVTLSQLSLVDGSVGRSAVLVFTMPFWTLLFAAFALGERMVGVQWWAVLLAALGLIAILEPWQFGGSVQSKLIAMSAGAAWAASAVIAKKIQNRAPIDLVSLTAWQMMFGSLLLVVLAYFVNEPATVWTPRFTAVLIFTAVVPTGLGWLVWLFLLQRLTAGVASMGILAVPVIAIASSAYQLGERLTPNEYVGVCLIVMALIILSWATLRAKRELVGPMTQE